MEEQQWAERGLDTKWLEAAGRGFLISVKQPKRTLKFDRQYSIGSTEMRNNKEIWEAIVEGIILLGCLVSGYNSIFQGQRYCSWQIIHFAINSKAPPVTLEDRRRRHSSSVAWGYHFYHLPGWQVCPWLPFTRVAWKASWSRFENCYSHANHPSNNSPPNKSKRERFSCRGLETWEFKPKKGATNHYVTRMKSIRQWKPI